MLGAGDAVGAHCRWRASVVPGGHSSPSLIVAHPARPPPRPCPRPCPCPWPACCCPACPVAVDVVDDVVVWATRAAPAVIAALKMRTGILRLRILKKLTAVLQPFM